MSNLTRFGEKLRALRTDSNLTLMQLSERLGYSTHSYISEIEAGKKLPTVTLVLKVADLYCISTDELLRDAIELSVPKQQGFQQEE